MFVMQVSCKKWFYSENNLWKKNYMSSVNQAFVLNDPVRIKGRGHRLRIEGQISLLPRVIALGQQHRECSQPLLLLFLYSYAEIFCLFQGVKCPSADQMVAKSLDNIVGNLWQQRQESSGSSVGNQVRFFYILKRCIVQYVPTLLKNRLYKHTQVIHICN